MNGAHHPVERKGLLIGAGYFSQFHLDAWQRLNGVNGVRIVAICDLDEAKARNAANKYGIQDVYTDVASAIQRADLDFVDIATAPAGRRELIKQVADRRLPIICQKPLANTFDEAKRIFQLVEASGIPFMVHENFRFQPWYREIKRLLESGLIGDKLHAITMRTRMGDGWGEDAYLARQPYFRSMERLLVHETGIHFIDTFRYLAGDIIECSAQLRQHNAVIAGEDAGILNFRFANGATAVWDANRYNEALTENPRYTFGELLVEANSGSIWLDLDGSITIKPLGQAAYRHNFNPSKLGFAGDCVLTCQQHFIDFLDGKVACETSPQEYLKSLHIVEAIYASSRHNRPVSVSSNARLTSNKKRRIIDLSLPVSNAMRGVQINECKTIHEDGWNARTLTLYSHCGTHMDAPKHFLPGAASLDQQDLSACYGRARIVNLAPAAPRQLHTVDDVVQAIGEVYPGDRLLIRTDWSKRFGCEEYRDALPRISVELARWLVEHQVALVGVEPPSVADVNSIQELTEVHHLLFRGGVVIVEGLTNLDQIVEPDFEFVALPLKILEGDGCPVRAIAIEGNGDD
jgi:D-apiose dehydrogenase